VLISQFRYIEHRMNRSHLLYGDIYDVENTGRGNLLGRCSQ